MHMPLHVLRTPPMHGPKFASAGLTIWWLPYAVWVWFLVFVADEHQFGSLVRDWPATVADTWLLLPYASRGNPAALVLICLLGAAVRACGRGMRRGPCSLSMQPMRAWSTSTPVVPLPEQLARQRTTTEPPLPAAQAPLQPPSCGGLGKDCKDGEDYEDHEDKAFSQEV